jgi:hypothetical protein
MGGGPAPSDTGCLAQVNKYLQRGARGHVLRRGGVDRAGTKANHAAALR